MELPTILKSSPLYSVMLILLVIFIMSIPLSFVLQFLVGPAIFCLPLLFFGIIFTLGFALFMRNVFHLAPNLGMNRKEWVARLISNFSKNKQKLGLKIGSYTLLPGEKELFQMTPIYVELGTTHSVRDVIVTNFRIIGGYTFTYLVGATETFSVNLWHSDLARLPEYNDKIGGDAMTGSGVIKEITLGRDESLGDYLRIKSSSMLIGHYSIYHPESEKIFRIFSSPLRRY
jgi:hypothetical protein